MPTQVQQHIVEGIRQFVEREVIPVASRLEHADEYPAQIVERMKELGLFGANVPEEFGGLALGYSTCAMVIEELARGWMSIVGPLGTHSVICDILHRFGTPEQQTRYLPGLASGERRGGLALSEADAGTDVQRLTTTATRQGDGYLINGAKMWITNARHGNTFVLAAKTDPRADPPYAGISAFVVEKGPGFEVVRDIEKLGYKGVETCELAFHDFHVPRANLIGGAEGQGFKHIMTGLESERLNVAARAVGLARAAFEDSIRYAQARHTFNKPICEHQTIQIKLADMATHIEAARLLVHSAAGKKDRGERCDLEAGMAKLFATEAAQNIVLEALRIHGGAGYSKDLPIERYYRDAPLLIVGGGTNELQRLIIAKGLLAKYPLK
ncbi:MAG TPA: acyl-CoA dehydrogenase family protein [Pirellulales bacterium]|jgi:alkylation response protein AidB-like acyl-CoA dehydrogenase|nr:acyl-CoA dehydrogenase family protein [Pirellulales bacterium]